MHRHTAKHPGAPQAVALEKPASGDITGNVSQLAASLKVLLTEDEAASVLGVSKRTFSTLRSTAEWLPAPIVLGPRLLRWSADELRAAVANMPRQTSRVQPESLLRARIEKLKQLGAPA